MPSGTIVYRTSREKHARIKDAAHAARASMNAWLDRLVDRELDGAGPLPALRGRPLPQAGEVTADERFLENAVQQAAGVEIVEDDYLGVVCCLPSPADEHATSPASGRGEADACPAEAGKVDGP